LASVIVAMMREIASQEDSNIVDAWQNGGEYKGRPVTDEMLLRHFRQRRDGVSKRDPLWDKWNNTLLNYEFSIAESKMSLKYAQHKVGEGQMADFYRKWAGKVPHNSEVYRSLMRSAAQFADAATSRAAGSRAAASQSGYNSAVESSWKKYERDYDNASSLLLTAAYRAGILQQTDTTTPDDLMDLRGGDEADHARFLDLFDQIQSDPYYADIKAALDKSGLAGLTYGQFVSLGADKTHGIDARIRIARQFGDESGAKAAVEEKTKFLLQRAKVADIDEFAAYENYRRTVQNALANDVMNPWEVNDLLTGYADALRNFRDSAVAEEDKGFFNNELSAFSGMGTIGPTAFEGTEGGIRTNTSADSLGLSSILLLAQNTIKAVEDGQAVLTVSVDKNGQEAYGTMARNDPSLSDPHNGTMVFLPGGSHGTIPAYAVYQPVLLQPAELDPRTGRPAGNPGVAGDQQVGVVMRINGHDYYGIYVGQGGQDIRWFADSPFKAGATVERGTDGMVVTAPVSLLSGTTDPTTGEMLGFDPLSVIDPRALNDELTYTNRFTSPVEAVYTFDSEARSALLHTSDAQLQAAAALAPDPVTAFAQLRDLRNTIVERTNARAFSLIDSGFMGAANPRQLIAQGYQLTPEQQAAIETFAPTGEPPAVTYAQIEHRRAVLTAHLASRDVPVPAAVQHYLNYANNSLVRDLGGPLHGPESFGTTQAEVDRFTGGQPVTYTPVKQAGPVPSPVEPSLRVPAVPQAPALSGTANVNLPAELPAPPHPRITPQVQPQPPEAQPRRIRTPRLPKNSPLVNPILTPSFVSKVTQNLPRY
jgi:hypothetical protein